MKLVDKDAVLAEINKRMSRVCGDDFYAEVKKGLYRSLIIYLNSLEEKEVDMEKELDDFLEENSDSNGFFNPLDIAKHFFELGLNASNPLTWEDILKCIRDAMNYHLYAFQSADGQQKVYEEVLKRFKAQKGESV